MAFPNPENVNTSSDSSTGGAANSGSTAATSHTVTLPTPITAGSLLMVMGRVAVAGTVAVTGGGWTIVQDSSDGSDDVTFWMYRDTLADGTEDGSTITVTHGSGKMVAVSASITGAEDPAIQPPQASTVAVGTDSTPNPTTCTPTGGAKDYLWTYFASWDGEQTLNKTAVTNYTSNDVDISSGTGSTPGTNVQLKFGTRQLNAASEDAPAMSAMSGAPNAGWTAWLIAVHPTSGTTTNPSPVAAAASVATPSVSLSQPGTAVTVVDGVVQPAQALSLAVQPVATSASTPIPASALPATTVVLYKCDDGDGVTMDDATGDSANDLSIETVPAASSSISFVWGANANGQQNARVRSTNLGIWHRVLTSGEKTALEGGEAWPFSTTTSLQDAKAFYLAAETSGSSTYDNAEGDAGNDLSAGGSSALVRVAGPLGSDFAVQFDNNNDFLQKTSPPTDLQHGFRSHTMACFVYFDTLPSAGQQAVICGQINLTNLEVGPVIYYHADNARFQGDYGKATDAHLRNNPVVVNSYSSVATGVWYFVLLEYDVSTNTLTLEVTPFSGATTATTFSPIARPVEVAPLISVGNAAKFETAPVFSSTSGFDVDGGRYAKNAGTADLKITNGNAKSIWFWMKRVADADTQTLMGFFNSSTNNINWVVQWSGGEIYFLLGNSSSSFDFTNVALNDTNTHLVVCRYDPSGPTISISLDNGAVTDSTGVTVTPAATSLEFRVGCATSNASSGHSQQFEGTLDCIGIMTGVMSAGEEAAIWNSGNGTESLTAQTVPETILVQPATPVSTLGSVITPVAGGGGVTEFPNPIAAAASVVGPTISLNQEAQPVIAAISVVAPTLSMSQAVVSVSTAGSVVQPSVTVSNAAGAVTVSGAVNTPTFTTQAAPNPVTGTAASVAPSLALAQAPAPVTVIVTVPTPSTGSGFIEAPNPVTAAAAVVGPITVLVYAPAPTLTTLTVATPTVSAGILEYGPAYAVAAQVYQPGAIKMQAYQFGAGLAQVYQPGTVKAEVHYE